MKKIITTIFLVSLAMLSACSKHTWDENTTALKLEFKLVVNDSNPDQMVLASEYLINNSDVEKAQVVNDDIGDPVIEIIMSAYASKKFAIFTEENIDRKLAIVLNGEILSAPTIITPIYGGNAWIVMPDKKDRAELQEIVNGIIKYRDVSSQVN